MKLKFNRHIILAASFVLFSTIGCNDVLEENPRQLTPEFFRTAQGLNSGVTAAYATFRNYYATESGMNVTVYGTDEFTHGQQVTNPPLNTYGSSLNPQNGDIGNAWGRAYTAINTCNGIIELGIEAKDLSETQRNALIAEAKFIRANWYFILVHQYGGATLDLGSGVLKFNTSTENFASRAPASEVYEAIINDLESITDGANNDDLPDARPAAALAGHAWKASALHLLSKVYLTRGWSTDAKADDFQKAYDKAMALINNKATYGVDLLPDYANVHKEGNEYNSETLFQVNWIDNVTFNNNTAFGGPNYQNRSLWLFNSFYHDNTPGLVRDSNYGRPWVRYRPTQWMLSTAFADKVNDSRFDKSFQTVWKVNSTGTNNPKKLALGDTAIWTVPDHLAAQVAPTKDSRRYVVFLPDQATDPNVYFGRTIADYDGYYKQNRYFPSLIKFRSSQPRAGNDANISSVRPFIVYRLAETYLLAAEAAYKLGNIPVAADLINVVRTRAAANPAAVTAMTATTLTDLTNRGIDYILDERTRELAGEQTRWTDLVRTGKLVERVKLYNNSPARPGAEVPNPQPHHVLRPIPQGQIDASVDPTTDNNKYPQNPGYN
jgi:starch-binding outer membrane protein, SusD/RagB family